MYHTQHSLHVSHAPHTLSTLHHTCHMLSHPLHITSHMSHALTPSPHHITHVTCSHTLSTSHHTSHAHCKFVIWAVLRPWQRSTSTTKVFISYKSKTATLLGSWWRPLSSKRPTTVLTPFDIATRTVQITSETRFCCRSITLHHNIAGCLVTEATDGYLCQTDTSCHRWNTQEECPVHSRMTVHKHMHVRAHTHHTHTRTRTHTRTHTAGIGAYIHYVVYTALDGSKTTATTFQ